MITLEDDKISLSMYVAQIPYIEFARKCWVEFGRRLGDRAGNDPSWTFRFGQDNGVLSIHVTCDRYDIYERLPIIGRDGMLDHRKFSFDRKDVVEFSVEKLREFLPNSHVVNVFGECESPQHYAPTPYFRYNVLENINGLLICHNCELRSKKELRSQEKMERVEKKKRNPPTKKIRFLVFQRNGFECVYCGATSKDSKLNIDHVVPISRGGTNELSNLVTACESCNRGKHTMDMGNSLEFN